MERWAHRKGVLTEPRRSPSAPRPGKYGTATAARLRFGILADAKGTRAGLPSAASTASGGEGNSPGSNRLVSEDVTSGGAFPPPHGPPCSGLIGQLRCFARRGRGGRAGLCLRVRGPRAARVSRVSVVRGGLYRKCDRKRHVEPAARPSQGCVVVGGRARRSPRLCSVPVPGPDVPGGRARGVEGLSLAVSRG